MKVNQLKTTYDFKHSLCIPWARLQLLGEPFMYITSLHSHSSLCGDHQSKLQTRKLLSWEQQ